MGAEEQLGGLLEGGNGQGRWPQERIVEGGSRLGSWSPWTSCWRVGVGRGGGSRKGM